VVAKVDFDLTLQEMQSIPQGLGVSAREQLHQSAELFADAVTLAGDDDDAGVILAARDEVSMKSREVTCVERIDRPAIGRGKAEVVFVALAGAASLVNGKYVYAMAAQGRCDCFFRGVFVHE
jgi:hypothetical protein